MISKYIFPAAALALFWTPPAFSQPALEEVKPMPSKPVAAPKPRPKSVTIEQLQILSGGPTLINFSAKDATFEQITRLFFPNTSGLPASDLSVKTIDVDWKAVPYYEALRQVNSLTKAGWTKRFQELGLLPNWDNVEISREGRPLVNNPFVQVKLVGLSHRSEHTGLFKTRQKALKANDTSNLQVLVAVDPKFFVPVAFVHLDTVRVGDRKFSMNEVGPWGPEEQINAVLYSNLETVSPDLPQGLISGTQVKEVKGYFRMYASPTVEWMKISDLLKATPEKHTFGKREFTLEFAKWDGQDLAVQFSVLGEEDLDGREQFFDQSITIAGMTIRDGQGNLLRSTDGSGSIDKQPDGRNKLTINWKCRTQFRSPGKPTEGPFSLEWPIPIDPIMYEEPFEIRDLAIP